MDNIIQSSKSNKEKGYKFEGKRKGRVPITITEKDILDKLLNSNGISELEGIEFPLLPKKSYYKRKDMLEKYGVNPCFLPSADKIDPDGIYSKENIRIVTRSFNLAKNNYSESQSIQWLNAIKNPKIETEINFEPKKINVMNTQNSCAAFAAWLIENNQFNAAKTYYENLHSVLPKNVEMKPKTTDKKIEPDQLRHLYFKENGVKLYNTDSQYICIRTLFNKKTTDEAQRCADAQYILDNSIIPYKVKGKGRGFNWYVKKSDVTAILPNS
jgi:hypothetical protein